MVWPVLYVEKTAAPSLPIPVKMIDTFILHHLATESRAHQRRDVPADFFSFSHFTYGLGLFKYHMIISELLEPYLL